jgi:CBS domain containing-hemolysin-like protein
MNAIVAEVILILLLIGANGVFALSEMAVVSVRRARLQHRAAAGDRRARLALELANTPQDFLATVQIGITLVGILAGALGRHARRADRPGAKRAAAARPYAEAIGLAIVVAAITYLSLVLGELVPKRLALSHADVVALAVAGPMRWLSRAARPAVKLLALSTDAVLALMRIAPRAEPAVTAEEIEVLIEQGAQAGTVESAERAMLASIFRLGERRVGHLMTPRTEIAFLDGADSVEEIQAAFAATPHGHYPLIAGTPTTSSASCGPPTCWRAARRASRPTCAWSPARRSTCRRHASCARSSCSRRRPRRWRWSSTSTAACRPGDDRRSRPSSAISSARIARPRDRPARGRLVAGRRLMGSIASGALWPARAAGRREVQYQTLGGFVMTALAACRRRATACSSASCRSRWST